jgi:hypothetical protein
MRIGPLALIPLLFIAGCTVEPEHAALQQGSLPPLIQAHRFAYHGNLSSGYQLSPDGRKLAWIGPSYARSMLHVRDNASSEVRKYRIRSTTFQWTPDGRRLLYAADATAAENDHVYMIDTHDPASEPVDLTPYPGVRASLHRTLVDEPISLMLNSQ